MRNRQYDDDDDDIGVLRECFGSLMIFIYDFKVPSSDFWMSVNGHHQRVVPCLFSQILFFPLVLFLILRQMSSRARKSPRKGEESAARDYYEEQQFAGSPGGTGSYSASSSTSAPTTAASGTPDQAVLRSKSIKSEGEITLQGPIEVAGSVRSGGNVTFNGDFAVRDKVEAYGTVEVNGNLACE